MRLHSVAEVMYVPESKEELSTLIGDLRKQETGYHILSGGSNVIFADRLKTPIVNMMELDKSIEFLGEGRVRVGCSVRIQHLIRELQKQGLGGIEYLYSVPTSVGGAVYMNAGRGKKMGLAISDYLENVEYYSPQEDKWCIYKKESGDFSYRYSPFQDKDYIITSATFCFEKKTSEDIERAITERIEYSRRKLSAENPSCGSVFCEGNRIIYRLLMGRRHGGAMYSKKTPDWISNVGNATADDVMQLINKGIRWHRWIGSKYRVEIKYLD